MAELKFMVPAMFEETTTRVYDLNETMYGIQTLSTDFNVKYGENAPNINGMLFSLINACIVSDFDEKFGYEFKASKTYRRATFKLSKADAHHNFNAQMEVLINEPIDDEMKSALMDADNFKNPIDGFDYLNLHNDAYAGIIFLVKSIIESADAEFKVNPGLADVYYQDIGSNSINKLTGKFSSIRVHKNKNGKNYTGGSYTVSILAFGERMRAWDSTSNTKQEG